MDHLTRVLLRARDGDRAALEQFVAETQADVWRLCTYLGDPDSAEDLAQEAYERAIGSLHRYRAEGPARHWMLTIARRTCADATRSRIRRRRLDQRLEHEAATVEEAPAGVEVEQLLAHLDEDRRTAFVLTQVIGLRYEEAAAVVGCPVGTIRSRVSRARDDLMAMLAGDGRDLGATG